MVQLLGAAVLLGGLLAVVVTTIASASAPAEGSSVPGSAVPVGTFTANTPFASGQGINVVLPANSFFLPTTNVNIVECAAPNGVIPTLPSACDGNTIQGPSLKSNADGSVNFQTETGSLYAVYALPDSFSLGESPSGLACGNTAATECILYIGDNQNDFTQPHLWSQPFYINTNSTDSGTPAGDGSAPPAATTPSASLSTVVASPSTNTANGTDVSIVTVTLLGTGSVPVIGKTVDLTGTGHSTISPETAGSNVTNGQGVATFSAGDQTAETVTYTAVDSTDSVPLDAQPTVDFQAPAVTEANSTVRANPTTVPSGSTTITVTVQDQGSPPHGVAGQTVALAGSPGSTVVIAPATTGSNVTNSSGVATFTATDTAVETVTFTATDQTDNNLVLTNTASVTFGNLVVSPTVSTVTASSPQPVGEGTSVTVTLLTSGGIPVSGKSVSLTGSPTGTVSITGSPTTTGSDGQATFTVDDSAPESDTFTAMDVTDSIPISQTATVAFQAAAASSAASTVSAATPTSPADGQTPTLVSVNTKDQFGKALPGKTVTLAVSGSALEHPISQGGSTPGVTDSTGAAYFEVDDTAAEVVTATAKDTTDGITVTQTATITYTVGAPDTNVRSSSVVASNASPPSDGTTATTITVTLTDLFGNPVSNKTISLSALPTGNKAAITSASPVTDSHGQATFAATDATAEVVTFQATDTTDGNAIFVSEAVVTFGSPPIPPPVATFSSVVATPSTVPADGATTSTISVLLYNGEGDVVPGRVVTLSASGGSSTVTAVNGTTTNTGNALFTVTDTSAESVTYTAEDSTDGVDLTSDPVTVQFTTASGSTTTTTTTTTTPGSGSTTTTTKATGSTTTTTAPGSTTTTTDGSSTSLPTSASSTGGDQGSSGSGSALAFTGVPPLLPWLVGIGVLLVGVGTVGRRRHSVNSE